MKRLTGIWRSALIMTLAMALIVVLFLLGILGYMVLTFKLNVDANFSTNTIDEALVQTADGYEFSAAYALDGKNQWAMLIDDSGDVIWSYHKPDEIPDHYTMRDVAAFTRWFIDDYPVRTRIRDDGLLVIGAPEFSLQRYSVEIPTNTITPTLFWFSGLFLVMLICVLGASALLLRRWFRKDQSRVDAALIHYQFETIHPFLDGNGRIGRLLILLYFIEKSLLTKPVICVSYFLKKNQLEYYDRISEVRRTGNYEQWVRFFLEAVNAAAIDATETIWSLSELHNANLAQLPVSNRQPDNLRRLFDYIEAHPIITLRQTADALALSYNTVAAGVKKLVALGILQETTNASRNRVFAYEDYLAILRQDT